MTLLYTILRVIDFAIIFLLLKQKNSHRLI
nr:MAG TPA: hypothetical protein [Caudoviricetes sp.]